MKEIAIKTYSTKTYRIELVEIKGEQAYTVKWMNFFTNMEKKSAKVDFLTASNLFDHQLLQMQGH